MTTVQTMRTLLEAVHKDEYESLQTLHMTSYENRMSLLAQSFLSSPLSYRYDFSNSEEPVAITGTGLLLKGLPGVFRLRQEAEKCAMRMFRAELSYFRPTSGLHATLCTILAATKVNDVIYSIDPDDGGHFATRHLVQRAGRISAFIPWDSTTLTIDLEKFKKQITIQKPDVILFEHGTPLFNLPVAEVRTIVGPSVLIVYDASHTLGLIAGGTFQDPLSEGCDILQGNTHKTFPGAQKGMMHFKNKEFGEQITASINSGLISSHHTHHCIAEYVTTLEMDAFGAAYAQQMIRNGARLAQKLAENGIDLVGARGVFTTSHEILIKGDSVGGHYEGARKLMACGISTNARVAFRTKIIRIGTQEITRRGMKENEMDYIATLFKKALLDNESPHVLRKKIITFNNSFPHIHYSFDDKLGLRK